MMSPAAYFVILPFLCAVCFAVGRLTKWDKLAGTTPNGRPYYSGIHALRGLLALSVFLHHAAVSYWFVRAGTWGPPASHFFAQLGPASVTMFFFITGFLFWSRLMSSHDPLRLIPFLQGRARRLLPAYLTSLLAVIAVMTAQFGLHLRVTPAALVEQLCAWVTCGVLTSVPGGFPSINENPSCVFIYARVFWSLRIEWAFYIALPLLAWFAVKRRFVWLLPGCVALIGCSSVLAARGLLTVVHLMDLPVSFAFYLFSSFSVGIFAAYASKNWRVERLSRHWACTPAAIVLWLMVMFAVPARQILISAALAPIFLMIIYGNTFHGLLSSRFLSFAGTISYSVYVFHGVALYAITQTVNRIIPVQSMSATEYWALMAATGSVAVVLSSCSFRFVEYPWIAKRCASSARVLPRPVLVTGRPVYNDAA